MLFITLDGPAAIVKDLEESIVEAMRFENFIGRILPLLSKSGGPKSHLVPGKTHGLYGFLLEIVFVDPLDLMANPGSYTNAMSHH